MAAKKVEVKKKVASKPVAEPKKIKSFKDEMVKLVGVVETTFDDAEQFDFGKKSTAGKIRKVLQTVIINCRSLRKAIVEKRRTM
jgi:hypothetical protein